jgi:hypothetical protein
MVVLIECKNLCDLFFRYDHETITLHLNNGEKVTGLLFDSSSKWIDVDDIKYKFTDIKKVDLDGKQ